MGRVRNILDRLTGDETAPVDDIVAPHTDAGFTKVRGLWYTSVLAVLHARSDFDWYLEIGTNLGGSLVGVRAKTISVDSEFSIEKNIVGPKPELHLFQQTSDEFFNGSFLDRTGIKFDVAFLDGMHLLEYLLRDFMNCERYCNEGATVLLHDCLPFNHAMAARDWYKDATRFWTGDVWKLLPILAKYRPDLDITVLNATPTGLVVVRKLDPENTILRDAYNDIVKEYETLTLKEYGPARFYNELDIVPCTGFLQGWTR